jgi:hypothetical protein
LVNESSLYRKSLMWRKVTDPVTFAFGSSNSMNFQKKASGPECGHSYLRCVSFRPRAMSCDLSEVCSSCSHSHGASGKIAALSGIPGLQERFYHKSLSFEISVVMSNEKVSQDEPSTMTRIKRSVNRITPEEFCSDCCPGFP